MPDRRQFHRSDIREALKPLFLLALTAPFVLPTLAPAFAQAPTTRAPMPPTAGCTAQELVFEKVSVKPAISTGVKVEFHSDGTTLTAIHNTLRLLIQASLRR
jgi:hypothetical protein